MSAVDELAVGDGWPGGGSPEQEVDTPEGYKALLRLVADQPPAPFPSLDMLRDVPPEQIKGGNVTGELSGLVAFPPHPQVEDLFVGRQAKRSVLAAALFPATGARRPVVVSGMAGVCKSYLVDRFLWESRSRFPQRLSAGGSRRRRAR